MATLRFSPDALRAYEALDKAGDAPLLDVIDDALDLLEADPGSGTARRRAFGDGLWGITVRGRSEDWLVAWEHDAQEDDLVRVRYIGPDPFA